MSADYIERLPRPSEVLHDPSFHFDGFQHQAHKSNIYDIPSQPAALLRIYPYDQASASNVQEIFGDPQNPETIQQLTAEHSWHMALIKRLGITVVPHIAEIVAVQTDDWSGPVWAATVRRINGRIPMHNEALGHHIPITLADRYVPAVKSYNRPGIMLDTLLRVQYLLSGTGAADSTKVSLVDMEPKFATYVAINPSLGRNDFSRWLTYARLGQRRN